MLCAWPQVSEDSSSFRKRGKGRTDIHVPITPFSPAAHIHPGPTQPPLVPVFWLQLGVMRIYPWRKEFAVSAPMCSYFTDSASGDGGAAMARKPLDTAGFVGRRGIITTFVRSPAPELPLFHADQI